jgi:putative cardiolipin synthase
MNIHCYRLLVLLGFVALAKRAEQHVGDSGFSIIRKGQVAFVNRLVMTDFAEGLVRAADCGVRVRVLLDDINTKGRDTLIALLDAHPNIEIRLFNPLTNRGFPGLDFIAAFNHS